MVPEASSTWKDTLIDHSQFPRGHRELPSKSHEGRGDNPLCGDRVVVQLRIDERSGVVTDIACLSVGCAISMASASLLADNVRGKSVAEAEHLFKSIRDLLIAPAKLSQPGKLGELEALNLVRQYPSRVKCATLAWHALRMALSQSTETTTTE